MKGKGTDEISHPIAVNNHLDWSSIKAETRRNDKNIILNMESMQEKFFSQSHLAPGRSFVQFILSK